MEIDALLLAKRQKRWTLFVIEAKKGLRENSLAKYKLVYSALAVSTHPIVKSFAGTIDVVPIYLRVWPDGERLLFRVVECERMADEKSGDRMFVSRLRPKQVRLLSMPSFDGAPPKPTPRD